MAARDSSGSHRSSPSTPISPTIPLTPQQKIIHKDLIKKGIPALILWLDKIKEDALTSVGIMDQVRSPFNTSSLKTNAATGKYAVILKWCVENIPDYDFKGIPPSSSYKIPDKAIKSLGTLGGPSAAAAATSRRDNTIEDWLKDPSKDEYGKDIVISLSVNSKYAILYRAAFKYLYELNNPDNKPLTKEIYKKIQGRLPKYHIYNFVINDSVTGISTTYNYDHLIMRNLSSYKISENKVDDKFFNTEYDIFEEIHIQVEKLLKSVQYLYQSIQALIKLIDINEIIIEYSCRLLEYVANILKFDKNSLAIKSANFDLQLTYKNVEMDKIKGQLYFYIYDKLRSQYSQYTYKDLVGAHLHHFNHVRNNWNDRRENDIRYIRKIVFYQSEQNAIIKFMKNAIFDIAELYEESKKNIDEYLPIAEDLTVAPPLFPSPPVLRTIIMKYVMLKNKIQLTKTGIEESTGEKRADLEAELQEYTDKMAFNYIISACEKELKEYEKKKKLYKLDVQKYERDLKQYKKDVLGKQAKFPKNSHSPTRVLPFTPIEKRAYKSMSPTKKSASPSPTKKSGSNGISNCLNDSDPLTQEAFEDMSEKKLKNLTKITTTITTSNNEKKKFVTCYDTVSLYNYILECYYKSAIAYNIGMGRDVILTNDDKNQVKKKIRAFTFNKTLPPIIVKQGSEGDPSEDTQNQKVFGRLIELYVTPYTINRNATVTGFNAIKMRIKISGIDFPIFEETFMKIPMLRGDDAREDAGEIPMISMIYMELLKKKKSGNLFTTNYFPYRKDKEYILKVPTTTELWTPNVGEDTLIATRERFYRNLTLM
jgi:hypothetical protein